MLSKAMSSRVLLLEETDWKDQISVEDDEIM